MLGNLHTELNVRGGSSGGKDAICTPWEDPWQVEQSINIFPPLLKCRGGHLSMSHYLPWMKWFIVRCQDGEQKQPNNNKTSSTSTILISVLHQDAGSLILLCTGFSSVCWEWMPDEGTASACDLIHRRPTNTFSSSFSLCLSMPQEVSRSPVLTQEEKLKGTKLQGLTAKWKVDQGTKESPLR